MRARASLIGPACVVVVAVLSAPAGANGNNGSCEEESTFGERGTYEIGGSVAGSWTDEALQIAVAPTFGIFVIDRVELSAQLVFTYARIESPLTGATVTSKSADLVFEPSYHYPVTRTLQLLGGFGIGTEWDGEHFDLALIPRVGVNFVVTPSSVITPSIGGPIRIGVAHGENGDVGTLAGIEFAVGITTSW